MSINIAILILAVVVAAMVTTLFLLWFFRASFPRSSHSGESAGTSESYLKTILAHVTDGLIVFDSQGVIKMFNPVAERMFGYQESEIHGKNADMLLTDLRLSAGGPVEAGTREVVGTRKSGATFQVDVSVSESAFDNQSIFIAVLHDVTERQQAEQRLVYLAQFDALTGLPTRMLFHDRATQALARADREEKLVAIMYLDLDHFKIINDSMGHHAGDELLKAVAKRITSCLRNVDTVSRMGGDEFTVILESIPHIDSATIVAEKILDAMQEPFHLDGDEVHVTASIGVTLYPMDDKELASLVKHADQAMYRAKQAGRNNYQLFGADMAENATAVKQMEEQIGHALERGELKLHYQPRVDATSGKIMGVEALLRWQHPEMGLVSAKDFMPLLERSRLVYTVDEWVLHTACLQNHQWQKIGLPPVRVMVNISPYRFRRKGLPELVDKVLRETGLQPEFLELDVPTENLVGVAHENYRAVLRKLSALGVNVALVDPAIGGSILDSFQKLPQYVMKIDRSFVRDATVDSDHAAIVQAVIKLARTMKLKVVAEGVETREQLDALRGYGCDMVQGYLFSKPVSTEDITRMLREGKSLI